MHGLGIGCRQLDAGKRLHTAPLLPFLIDRTLCRFGLLHDFVGTADSALQRVASETAQCPSHTSVLTFIGIVFRAWATWLAALNDEGVILQRTYPMHNLFE